MQTDVLRLNYGIYPAMMLHRLYTGVLETSGRATVMSLWFPVLNSRLRPERHTRVNRGSKTEGHLFITVESRLSPGSLRNSPVSPLFPIFRNHHDRTPFMPRFVQVSPRFFLYISRFVPVGIDIFNGPALTFLFVCLFILLLFFFFVCLFFFFFLFFFSFYFIFFFRSIIIV